MNEIPKELTKEEYDKTFSPPMRDVTKSAEEIVDLWAYADPIIEEKYHAHPAWEWRVTNIYESEDESYQHINIAVPQDDTYLSILVHKPSRSIVGHYVIDLGALYPDSTRDAQEICPSCGNTHNSLSISIPVSLPTAAAKVPTAQRDKRVWSNGELCVVDDEKFYLYGSINIKLHGHADEFAWGAWVELEEDRFFWYQDLLDAKGRQANAPFSAVLGTYIPYYPTTIGLPILVHVQPHGLRPVFLLERGAHPLIRDQENGISIERLQAIKDWFNSLSQ